VEELNLAFKTSMDIKVGIGLAEGDEREKKVLASVAFCPVFTFRDAPSMLDALAAGDIEAAARGSLPSDEFLAEIRARRMAGRTRRTALLVLSTGKPFLLGPVGVDEGGTRRDTEMLVKDARAFAGLLGWEPKVAVLSAGRDADRARSGRIARSVERAEAVARSEGARHYNVMIEEALEWANCVIAPDGVAGNLIYRSLAHLGGAVSLGALYFPLSLRLADTSRNGTVDEYVGAIALANISAARRHGRM
jgi:predicted methyltransferase MtxX (methanogen marker protein 4)